MMKKLKQKKKKHLKRWVKILIVFLLLIPCFFFAKDVYAEYYPFTSIIDESDPTKEISYSAIDHTFVDGSLRGRGGKARLVCSYARSWFANHPEEADLLER